MAQVELKKPVIDGVSVEENIAKIESWAADITKNVEYNLNHIDKDNLVNPETTEELEAKVEANYEELRTFIVSAIETMTEQVKKMGDELLEAIEQGFDSQLSDIKTVVNKQTDTLKTEISSASEDIKTEIGNSEFTIKNHVTSACRDVEAKVLEVKGLVDPAINAINEVTNARCDQIMDKLNNM